MGSYLQHYGAGEERRNRNIRNIILGVIGLVLLLIALYFIFRDYSEKQTVKRFIAELNSHQFPRAYADWGCTVSAPCRNYDYQRFLQDWGPEKQISSPWKVTSVDGCKAFVTVNVQAAGAELQSLGVERGTKTLMYAPAPECQEPRWHWKQFFQRLTGNAPPPTPQR